jgi:cysteine-rich repeat protein
MKLRKIFTALAVFVSLALAGGDFILPAHAQIDTGLDAIGQTVQLPDTDPRIIAARLINVFLGLLGIILLVIILYAGFLWMTAGGDAAKVEKAKAWLRNGIIGVVIVLLSWAIASFVINSLINAATGGSGGVGGTGGTGGTGGGGFGGGSGDVFRIVAKSPEGSVGNADLVVRILFNRDIDDSTLSALSISPQPSGAWEIDPTNSKRILFAPTDPCPGVPQKGCFAFDTQFSVTASTDLRSTANQQLRCGGFYPDCTFTFTSGNTVDTNAPNIQVMSLYDGMSVSVNTAVEVLARATDDIGISGMEWEEGGQIFHSDGPQTSPSPQSFESSGYWDTVGKALKQTYTITVSGTDLDTNTGSESVDVIVLSEHCFDGIQNQDETGTDCGGVDCLDCSGGACQTNSQCASGLCINNVCIEQPVITDVKPLAGAEGTYVSIWGNNFGDTGTVTFLGPPEVTASAPQACVAQGATTWSNNYALVEVPAGAGTGPIRLTNGNSNLSDQTDDTLGPAFEYTVNSDIIPGLCGATPTEGTPGTNVSLDGTNFGGSAGTINFSNSSVQSQNWSNSSVNFLAPVINPGLYPVWLVHSSGAESNKVPFTVKSSTAPQPAPTITYIDPTSGPRGQFITIVGERFGYTPGVVSFYDKAADKTYTGDAAFSQGCSEGWWKDNNIVIKVPSVDANVTKPAQFAIYIKRSDSEQSNNVDFTYTDGQAGPGICTINPNSGPAGSFIELHGENLGAATPGNQVIFSTSQIADILAWQPTQIDVTVPNQAITGPLFATVSGQDSNSMQFAVADCRDNAAICDSGQTCCPNGTCVNGSCSQASFSALYSWQFSTGVIPKTPRVVEFCDSSGNSAQLPSPTPWLNHTGGDQVCVATKPLIGMLFDIDIDWPPAQSADALFSLKKCIGSGADPCDELEDTSITTPDMTSGGDPYVSFEPLNNLEPDTTYYVFVSSEIRSADLQYGTQMDEDTNCPEPGLGYCYRFRTRSDTGPCQVGNVYVKPWQASVQGNETQDFEAIPAIKNAECSLMACDGFDFNWATDPLSKAEIVNSANPSACKQTVQAFELEATNPPVQISAEEDQSKLTGFADLYIQYITPRVVANFPDCSTACANIRIGAQLNTSLWSDPPPAGQNSVELKDPYKPGNFYKNVKLYRCATENCFAEDLFEIEVSVTLEEISSFATYQKIPFSFIQIEPIQDLIRGTYYQVWLNGGAGNPITSKQGTPLPQPYTWQFRTRLDNETCQPEAINVSPTQRIEEKVGDTELFTARVLSGADDCSAEGQLLKVSQSFDWSLPTQQVASFVLSQIDTGADLPAGCSNDCLAEGANGIFGAIAMCGNSIIETTDANYCQGGTTLAGEPCSLFPIASGAGEQCDGGALCDLNTCLWKPVPGGDCGNGTIEYSQAEMCDPGLRCYGITSTTQLGLEGSLCNNQTIFDDCNDAGGSCEVQAYNGCSAGCKNLGASSVQGTTCGNGDIAEGEDCDLGNDNGTGGCSNNCLHSGSSASVSSVCGNGVIEPGETCDAQVPGGQLSSRCDPVRCVDTGTSACATPQDQDCCGNNLPDEGEQCDDGNKIGGDGCGANCLLEGSSWKYPTPSFCGDGILSTGELCESIVHTNGATVSGATAGIGDGKIDPIQLAIIDPGLGTPDPITKELSTTLSCTYDQITGDAIYGVGCGKTDESQCDPGYGLDSNGCCAPRPKFDPSKPLFPAEDNNGQGFCRNVLIEANFESPMNPSSVISNFVIAKEIQGNDCPDGTEVLALDQKPDNAWGWIAYTWNSFVSWIKGQPASAVYCTQAVPGTLVAKGTSTTAFVYRLQEALDPNTRYIVRFNGDPNLLTSSDDDIKQGIQTNSGVSAIADVGGDISNINTWEYTWWFETGADICRVNSIQISDTGPGEPFYYKKAFEEHLFNASAKSVQNGQAQAISPIPGTYNWLWEPWVVNNPELAQTNDDQSSYTQEVTQSAIRATDQSGYAWVFASLKITEDALGNGNTTGLMVSGSEPITIFICDNPWPLRKDERFDPFRDADQSIVNSPNELWLSALYDDLFTTYPNGPFFNFQTMYCRDHKNGLLPALQPNLIPLSLTDIESGIMRQYLLTFNVPAFKSDGIGIRVYKNPNMDTPLEWYKRRNFAGSPETLEIDGYPAIRDGGTVYLGFANTTGLKEKIYPNILVISHNVGASVVTQDIFTRLVNNLAFNINFEFDNGNVCVKGGITGVSQGEIYLDSTTNAPVTCVSDWDCLTIDNSPDQKLRCASFKYKLQHDVQRLAHFKQIDNVMEAYYNRTAKYPVLSEGTFQKGRTNSRWPSWQESLGADLGITLPVDPINRFVSCGLCKPTENPAAQSTVPCAIDSDCNEGYFCEGQNGFDPQTCWNPEELQFMCPYMESDGSQAQVKYDPYGTDEPFAPSRFYKYRSFDGGRRYELAANFEVPPASFVIDGVTGAPLYTEDWWMPPYNVELRKCKTDNPVSNNRWCNTNDDCKPCLEPNNPKCLLPAPVNSCQPTAYRYQFKNICNNDIIGESGICGDGVKGLVCSGGANQGSACANDNDCPNSSCSSEEFCELGETKIQTCDFSTAGAKDGYMLTVCQDCKQWVQDPILSSCQPKLLCGNGRIDGYCGGNAQGAACTSDTDCDANVTCEIQEACDDGVLNGAYGYCGLDCQSFDKFCGDKQISPNEACDRGTDPQSGNGAYCSNPAMCYAGQPGQVPLAETCGLGCAGKAPFCGDGRTSSPEQCDGEVSRTITAICGNGPYAQQPCKSDEDCGYIQGKNDYTCGATASMTTKIAARYNTCQGVTQSRCATAASVCLTDTERKSLIAGTLLPNNPNIASTYATCQSNAGCSGGRECIPLSLGIKCLDDSQCSNANISGICRDYGTEHIRRCGESGTADQCIWESTWSSCTIAKFCGDGLLDPGEECDDGIDNATNKACLPTCKFNVCGDGNLYTQVEECDNGDNNGKATCQANYGSTCNDCSLQCKNVAKAGGYCGNDSIEPGEQCDGNISIEPEDFSSGPYIAGSIFVSNLDASGEAAKKYAGDTCTDPPCQIMKGKNGAPTDLTCEKLGFDFALNDNFNQAIQITDNNLAFNSGYANYISIVRLMADNDKNELVNKIFVDCGLMEDEQVSICNPKHLPNCIKIKGMGTYWLPQSNWPTVSKFRQCVEILGQAHGFKLSDVYNQKPSCSTGCQPTGCGRCSNEVGDGEIFGYILDRIWLQAVPQARVTLQYRGVNVESVLTDENGKFEFNNLSSRGECDKFRLIIDKYDNNPCTELSNERPPDGCARDITADFNRSVDEAANGGYWPFTTDEFSIEQFPNQENLGMIYIYPRPAAGEGYVSYGRPSLYNTNSFADLAKYIGEDNIPQIRKVLTPYTSLWDPRWAPHIVWPENHARLFPYEGSGLVTYNSANISNFAWDKCSYENRGTSAVHSDQDGRMLVCARDYNWLNQGGNLNLNFAPFTGMLCPSLQWDKQKGTQCPLSGTTKCNENCNAKKGIWELVYSWTGLSLTPTQCTAYCDTKPSGNNCPTTGNLALQRCYNQVSSAQASGIFRYASPVEDLQQPLHFYFAGPEYDPIYGEYTYTAGKDTATFNNLVSAGSVSWSEKWKRLDIKIYISTSQGIKEITSVGGNTRADFRKPFWHLASINAQGEVNVINKWYDVAGLASANILDTENGQPYLPSTQDNIKDAKALLRPPGLACWNGLGASCSYDVNRNPNKMRCFVAGMSPADKELVRYLSPNEQPSTIEANLNSFFSALNITISCYSNNNNIIFNSTNW